MIPEIPEATRLRHNAEQCRQLMLRARDHGTAEEYRKWNTRRVEALETRARLLNEKEGEVT